MFGEVSVQWPRSTFSDLKKYIVLILAWHAGISWSRWKKGEVFMHSTCTILYNTTFNRVQEVLKVCLAYLEERVQGYKLLVWKIIHVQLQTRPFDFSFREIRDSQGYPAPRDHLVHQDNHT